MDLNAVKIMMLTEKIRMQSATALEEAKKELQNNKELAKNVNEVYALCNEMKLRNYELTVQDVFQRSIGDLFISMAKPETPSVAKPEILSEALSVALSETKLEAKPEVKQEAIEEHCDPEFIELYRKQTNLLKKLNEINYPVQVMGVRNAFTCVYGWSLLSTQLAQLMFDHGLLSKKILSVGAGFAHNERNLKFIINKLKLGGSLVCTDIDKQYKNKKLDACNAIIKYMPNVLMMLWPSNDEKWTGDALEIYNKINGQWVVYVGEEAGGCTGNARFHEILQSKYKLVAQAQEQYNWYGIRDSIHIYKRI